MRRRWDRESAFEMLQQGVQVATGSSRLRRRRASRAAMTMGYSAALKDILFGSTGPRGGKRDGYRADRGESAVRQVTNQIVRGMLGSLLGRTQALKKKPPSIVEGAYTFRA
ncbi:nucleotide triphosphate hydrolase domain-containing protein [Klebsiella variicola]|uniref:Nucleotide triphosphate hydrolase domain-containing protein n=1 Tax=Klebsiella variicola TaxID=244366 RepID=A0A7H4MC90_KLEVA|nr:nucleotide triphosphate hydrolase domain-containing protein [Klebsiella variicola]